MKISTSRIEIVEQETLPLTRSARIKKIIILIIALIGFNLFVWGTLYYTFIGNSESTGKIKGEVEGEISPANKLSNLFQVKKDPTPTPEIVPFEEITIPYLRSRDYRSSLGNLSLVSQNESYTSYLTSYDSDGFRVNGQLTIPVGKEPDGGFPAIIFIHGYIPPQSYQTLGNYVDYVDFLARNGYVVFKIDLRGHGDSEGEANGAYFSSDYIVDTLNARAALQKSGFANKNKIGLWGHSMAGNVVSRALAVEPTIPAIVIWAGAVYTYEDFYEYQIQDSSYQPPEAKSERIKKRSELFGAHGVFDKNSPFWSRVPMTNYLDDIEGAISIHHAVDDFVVDIGYSRSLNEILNSTKIEHELIEYPSGGHNINGLSFTSAMQNTIIFFDKHLK